MTSTFTKSALTLTALFGLLAGAANAADPVEGARQSYLPKIPAAVTTTTAPFEFDLEAIKSFYTHQPVRSTIRSTDQQVFPDGIAQARDSYVYAPQTAQAETGKQVASR